MVRCGRRMRKIRNRRIFYVLVLAVLLLGGRGTDIGQLRPVEVVRVYEKAGLLFLETDTGDAGWGLTVDEAVKKLKETTMGEIYLDTADYLLLEEGIDDCLGEVRTYLKKKTKMAYSEGKIDLEVAASYLRVHSPSETVGNGNKPMEMLSFEGGKIILKKFKEI